MQSSEPFNKQVQNSLNQTQLTQAKLPNNVSDTFQANNLNTISTNQNIQNLSNLTQPQNQVINTNQSTFNNAMNSSTNLSLHESQSSLQNQNFILNPNSNPQGSANFPSKEYFNFQFFKRQMSSQSSDIDFCGDNREGLNDFFAARFNSVLSKDSSKQQSNIFKNSVDRNSCDLDLTRDNLSTNLGNKDEPPQINLIRANSASSKKKCSNYIPKTFYFQSHNSTTPSCFYKKRSNTNSNINNDQNLVLRYYGNNKEYNLTMGNNKNLSKNKYLDVINDKDDENEEEDCHDDKENEEDSDDDCIITSKDDNFNMNYLNNNITLPKRTFTLVHRTSSQLVNKDEGILSLRKNIEEQKDKNNEKIIDKKKLPPVKTNTFCGSSKNNLNIDDKENDDDNEFDNKKIKKEENKADNKDDSKEKEENNKNEESNDSDESSDNIPDFSYLKNFKSKKDNNSNNNSQNEDNNENNEISDYFFSKNNNINQNQNEKETPNNMNEIKEKNIIDNQNNLNMEKILQINNNNYIQYQLNKNQNLNNSLYPQNYNTIPLMMGTINANQPNNNLTNITNGNQKQIIQGIQNLNLNNSIINNFNTPQNYLNNNYSFNNTNVDDLLKNVSNFIKDQAGCRLIQKKIDENPPISNSLFEVLYQDLPSMCKDLFGNYVVQKILENIKSNYLVKFLELISKDFINLAVSTYGTRVIQKILEIVSNKSNYNNNLDKDIYEQCFQLVNNQITNNIVVLSSNNNSSHIIIKYVNEIRYPKNIQLFNEVYRNYIPLCKDKHGCCVIQKCIDFGNQEQKNKLLELSNANCESLISDQFGNYVIQFVVSLNIKIVNQKVFQVLKNNLCSLCKEKYASNVIEKFLANKSEESFEIINTLLKDEKILHELIIDQFGNYIIQRILMLVEGESRSLLIHYIVQWYPEIKSLPFGPRLISKLHERYQEFTLLITQNYGWDTTQETVSYLHLNPSKFNNNNNIFNKNNLNNNNKNISGPINIFENNYMNNNGFIRTNNPSISQMLLPNFRNSAMGNRTNNNNCMNFKNKSNVGNINFIQMNNYMLSPGINNQNNQRFLNNNQIFNNINNLNNNQMLKDINGINTGLNNNLFFLNQRDTQKNYFNNMNDNFIQRLNNYGQNINANNSFINMQYNNLGNNNPNMLSYQQYLNMNLPNIKK